MSDELQGRRVVHLTSVHIPTDNRILFKECTTLESHGYQVTLLAPHTHDEELLNVQIKAVSVSKSRLRRILFSTPRLFLLTIKIDADIYHAHDPELLPLLQILRILGKRVIYDMHENMPAALQTKPWLSSRLKPLTVVVYRIVERILLHRIPVIFAEDSYAREYPWIKRSTTVRNMPRVEALLKVNAQRHKQFTIGYIGRVAAQRGSLKTLEAMSILAKRNLEVRWECVGLMEKAHEIQLLETTQQYGLSDKVKFHGYLPPTEGWQVIAQCHLGMATLLETPNYVESYPTKLFEYMAMGIPIITSHFALYRSIVEETGCGLCVDPDDPVAIADAIQWIHDNPSESREMALRGKEAVSKRFRWETEAKHLLNFYERILNRED